jgi:membrane protein DedA with SNARE-associated domain
MRGVILSRRHAGLLLDNHLSTIIANHGQTTYAILFAIVFAETGLVLTPFLPGACVPTVCASSLTFYAS